MSDEDQPPEQDDGPPADSNILVFRSPQGRPVAVPDQVATAGERAYRCYKLRIEGLSWMAIAEQEGYPDAKAAQSDVDRYMALARSLVVESSARDMLTLEIARLDAIQNALWPAAMTGHVPSAVAAKGVIMDRAKLAGLDPEKMGEEVAQEARTVVVRQDSYIEGLKAASGSHEPLSE